MHCQSVGRFLFPFGVYWSPPESNNREHLTPCFCFFKQKTAYEMRISDWSSDACSSDLWRGQGFSEQALGDRIGIERRGAFVGGPADRDQREDIAPRGARSLRRQPRHRHGDQRTIGAGAAGERPGGADEHGLAERSEEHTSELQSLMRNSYSVFCLKKKKKTNNTLT